MDQQNLPLPARPREDVPDSIVYSCQSLIASVRLMIVAAGYDDDQVGYHLGYSPSHWSEILNGKKNLPWPKLLDAMAFCDNHIPLFWLCYSLGYEKPHPSKSALEKDMEQLQRKYRAVCDALGDIMKGGARP